MRPGCVFLLNRCKDEKLLYGLLLAVSAFAQDVVFRGTPKVRVFATPEKDERQQLDHDSAYKNECVIVQRGKKYLLGIPR